MREVAPGGCLFAGAGWLEGGGGLLLRDPVRVLTTQDAGEVPALLEAAQRELERGRYLAGYLSYEAGAAYGLATHEPSDLAPLVWLAVYPPEHAVAFPLVAQASKPVASTQQMSLEAQAWKPVLPALTLNVTAEEYRQAIGAIRELIAAGDTYQVNYTCHARFALDVDPLAYFLALARSHPVPYSAYLNLGSVQVLSVSPELFLQRRGQTLETRPMKGTRRRGCTPQEDAVLRRELVTSEKERAENLMILDMARNDLGRLCMAGSVEVPARFTAEKYRSVWQMTSTVRGTLPPGITLGQILAATFPGASITGAPKAHTMEIIRDLEREPRGIYTGALGVFLPGGDFTLNLPIRTLVHRAGRFDLGLGAGIVWDSQAESEYEETLLKGSFALRLAPDLRLFETLALTGEGAWTYLEAHLARLGASAEYWDFPWDPAAARARLAACAREAGPLPRVVRMELDQDGVLNLTSRPLPAAPPAPVRVRVSAQRTDSRDRFLFHKTNQRALYDRERESAEAQGCFEALFCNERGEVTEGAITNLFARIGGRWLTPPLSAGLLPGIWREVFREETGAEEAGLPLNWLKEAEEVVIGNSVRGALTVDEIVDDAGQIWWRRADGPGHTKGEMSL